MSRPTLTILFYCAPQSLLVAVAQVLEATKVSLASVSDVPLPLLLTLQCLSEALTSRPNPPLTHTTTFPSSVMT